MIQKKNCITVLVIAVHTAFNGCDIFNPSSGNNSPDVSQSIVSVNTAADYSEGNTSLYDIEEKIAYVNLLPIDSDNKVKCYNGSIYIIEKGQCDIIKITGSSISQSNVDNEQHIGNATNIHDIAFISKTKAYVTQYGATDVVIYNPESGGKTDKTISLAYYTPQGASNPNMDAAVYYDGNVYIGLQKYDDNWSLTDNSSVVVIDTEKDEVQEEIILNKKNPQGMFVHEGKLYIACTGSYGIKDGGVEIIDLSSHTTEGVLLAETDLDGDVSNILIFSNNRGYAVVAGADWSNSVVCFNPSNGNIITKLSEVGNATQFGLATSGIYLYVADRSATNPGLYIIDPSDNTLVSGPYDMGMPPNAIALLEVEK